MPTRRLPPLYAIRAFEAAARHRSMTGAAGELAVTPGAISRHVRSLEARMETPLFLRRSTGLELTPAGEMLAQSVGEALDRIAEATSGARLSRYRQLSIGVYSHFASRFLLPRWHDLTQRHPDLEIDLHTSTSPLDLLPEHYDAVIAVGDGTPQPGLAMRKLLPIATDSLGEKQDYEGMGKDVDVKETNHAAALAKDYLFEPSGRDVLDTLLPLYINFQVYQMLVESRASEHSARMVAMKGATDNAKKFIKELTLEYNKLRQAAITAELLEITTAMRAMQ